MRIALKSSAYRPPRAPLAMAALAFSGGIWLAGSISRSPLQWGAAAFLSALCALLAVRKSDPRLANGCAILSVAFAGAFAFVEVAAPRVHVPPPELVSGSPVEVIGHVTNDGSFLNGGSPRERFDLQSESLQIAGHRFDVPFGIRATVFVSRQEHDPDHADTGGRFPALAYGDRVRFTARLRLPRNFGNPGAFDYEGYLRGIGITALASVKAENIRILPGESGTRFGFWRSRIRRSILNHINNAGLWSHEDAPLFAAMILGEDSLLLRNVKEEFQETGMYHLLVVSGMNVALLAFAVFWVARRLRAPDWLASLITIALSIFYAYVAGMGVPIQRAVLMLSLFLVARLLYRERAALNATGFAALVVLLLSPRALFEPGFQLTFLALLAISGISLLLLHRSSYRLRAALRHFDSTGYDLVLPARMAQLRLDLRLIISRIGKVLGATPAKWIVLGALSLAIALFELTLVSSITQAALVLPMRAYFHRAAIIGMPANALVLPLSGVMLNAGVAAIALSYISGFFARIAGFVAAVSLHWTLLALGWLSRLHISQWRIPDPNFALWMVAVVGVTLAFFAARRTRSLAVAGLALLFLSAGFAAVYDPAPHVVRNDLEVTAIDVGQGDSILVSSPEGRTMLVDAGGSIGPVRSEFDYGEDVVSPYLWWRGLKHLDVVVLTHAHGDHIGGMARIVQNFRPRELWLGMNPETPALDHLLQVAAANGVAVRKHVAGDELDWGGAHIRVLSPPADWRVKAQPRNDDSLSMLISFRNTRALLAGDVEKRMERFLATESPAADLLKVAHHGSATSTTEDLLRAVHPQYAVISDGYRNSFGHPRPQVLERLQSAHVRTYRTDLLGGVTFLLDGKTVEPELTRMR
ncbi:MAG TPA: ComEC/Rec2 family competence protein [Terriglobales bacterium]|nr:ComEC/Rec2 family competence protein [Terriglobales bacterium]